LYTLNFPFERVRFAFGWLGRPRCSQQAGHRQSHCQKMQDAMYSHFKTSLKKKFSIGLPQFTFNILNLRFTCA
jgi:hypothetical protein